MINRIFMKTMILCIILLSISSSESIYGKENSADEFIIGKLEFAGKNGHEGIVTINSPGKAYLLNKGVLLVIIRGSERIVLKVNDTDGKYLKCVINNLTDSSILKEGEDVYYSESINSGKKYRDAKRILAQLIKLYENFILKIESSEDKLIISETVKNFSIELDKLIPEMKIINSRYPELAKFNISPPDELRNESVMLEALEPRLKEAFFKVRMFSSDEDVKRAIDDLQKVLTKMSAGN